MAMSQQHKSLLTRNRLRLVREVILSQEFYAVLQSNYTLTATMVEEIDSIKTSQGKVAKLLDILPKRGSEAFPTFIEALTETHQEPLAALLDPSHTSSLPSSSGRVISQPKDSGPGGDQFTPSAIASSTDQPGASKSELGVVSSRKQSQQPSDALSGNSPSSKGPVQPSHENATSKTPSMNISGWSDVEEIIQCVHRSQNESFIFNICTPDDGEQPDKTESLRDGRGLVVRNKLKKRGYEPQFDDVNLIESFKKFGIKVESMFENTSPEGILQRLHKEAEIKSSAFFLFMFAPGSGDVIVTDDGNSIPTFKIVDIVKESVALKGKPKVLIFHLIDSGPVDNTDSVAEPADGAPADGAPSDGAPSLEFSGLSLNTADDNLAILKVALSSDDVKVHWLVSSLIFLMTKYSNNYDLDKILDRVKCILEKQGYLVKLSRSLKSGLYFTS